MVQKIFEGKTIILRVDYNVPILNNKITEYFRINQSFHTLNFILKTKFKKLIIISHLGRPSKDKKNSSLKIVHEFLKEKINIKFAETIDHIKNSNDKIFLLENIRYLKGEKNINSSLGKDLTELCDIYINDAFGCSHRNHTSITKINPPLKLNGFLIQKEVSALSKLREINKEDITLVLGGSKISDKIDSLLGIIKRVKNIVIGGGMAFTFLYNKISIGKSILDKKGLDYLPLIYEEAKKYNTNIFLPIDFVVADKISNDANTFIANNISKDKYGLDIGPKTISYFEEKINTNTVIWNGPMGIFEIPKFEKGTCEIAKIIAHKQKSFILGGDTYASVTKFKMNDLYTYISSGGGASLEFIAKGTLIGIQKNNLKNIDNLQQKS